MDDPQTTTRKGSEFSRRALLRTALGASAGYLGVAGGAFTAVTAIPAVPADGELHRWFDRRFGAWVAGDIPRSYDLGDGETLWITNDSYLTGDPSVNNVSDARFQRNAAFVEREGRLGLIHSVDQPYLGNPGGSHFDSWFWFHGSVRVDNRIEAFVSLMRRTGPLGWGINFEYASTWIATLSTRNGSVLNLRPAPNPGTRPLYGFSVESEGEWTYLFGNNASYDSNSVPNYLARVPFGEVDRTPTYWNGRRWVSDANEAASIYDGMPGTQGLACRLHAFRWGDQWWATHKFDEFFGREIHLLRADNPTGPWTIERRLPVASRTGDGRTCTYDARARPKNDHTLQLWWSNNAYAEADVRANASLYRPTMSLLDVLP